MLAVIDTHALIWGVTGQKRRLGRNAARFLERADAGKATVYVPTLSLVELGDAVHRGAITLDGGLDAWLTRLLASGRYVAADLTVEIVRRAESLRMIPERSDRLIAATALELDCPLITRDPKIAAASGLDLIW